MKNYLFIIFAFLFISCSDDGKSLFMLQIEVQKEENRETYWIDLDNVELRDSYFETLRKYPVNELWLTNNGLVEIPDGVFKLKALKHLSIQRNPKITTINEDISGLINLENLWILGTEMSTLPNAVFKLTELKQLIATSNKLTIVSDSLKYLSKLELLDLGDNKLSNIPYSISELEKLNTLYLNGNQNIEFEEIIKLTMNLPFLTKLYLHNNDYSTIPSNLHKLNDLKSLKKLNLQNNLFTEFQKDSIRHILNIEEIIFWKAGISHVIRHKYSL